MELSTHASERLTVEGAARHTGLSASTLNKMRLDGSGPRFLKVSSRRVVYDTDDLNDWLTSRRRMSTSDSGLAAIAK
jgi:predicted DNA-binding transcriptional regulator AlpA